LAEIETAMECGIPVFFEMFDLLKFFEIIA